MVVRHLERAIPPSRQLPDPERNRILEIDSQTVDDPETLERVLAFLGEPAEPLMLDLSDHPGAAIAGS